jgi:hypothetical protein
MTVADSLAELAAMERAGLAERWAEVFGHPAPLRARVTLLRGALAWRIQLQAQAGAGRADGLIRGLRRSVACAAPAVSLAPGARLLREWQGHTHHVTVVAEGFEYSGRTWASLSAIALAITGTAWSGPRFFGLRS